MIGSILMCDRCGDTGGALPCADGATSRKVAYRGSIRRIKLGRTFHGGPQGRLASLDLCKRCNRPDVITEAQIRHEHSASRWGDRFERA